MKEIFFMVTDILFITLAVLLAVYNLLYFIQAKKASVKLGIPLPFLLRKMLVVNVVLPFIVILIILIV